MVRSRYTPGDGTIRRARQLRRDATPAELHLWSLIRGAALAGAKFRRQQRFGPYHVDFVCLSRRLIVEVDGDTHYTGQGPTRDERRTAYLEHEGFRVMRFTNLEVMTNSEGVTDAITRALTLPPPTAAGPSLSPKGERD